MAIMAAVKRSVRPLENVILLTFFWLVFYALLGTQFLQKTMSSRCLRKPDKMLSYPARFCDSKALDGYKCPKNQKCGKYGNPNYGSTSFDYVWFSLITMFQIVSLEGWSLIMYCVKDAEGERANSYFMSLVVIGAHFLTNLFIAGISGVFLRVRAEHQALLKKNRQTQTSFYSATVMANILRDDIIKDDASMRWHIRLWNKSKRARRSVSRAFSRTQSSMRGALSSSSMKLSRTGSMSRSISMGTQAALSLSEQCRAIVERPSFDWGVLLAVTVNGIILCLFTYGMSREFLLTLYGLQAVLLVVFLAELLLRFLAYGPFSFVSDKMNLVDLFAITVSAGALISRRYPNISALRVLRWFYLSKKHVERKPSVMATCLKSVGSLVSVFFFYLLVIVAFSIISTELYSGQYYNFSDGYPRADHDTMLQAMLLWFSVTTAESWPNQMWNSMRPGVKYNGFAPLLYIFYFVLTVFIIMNLIIAVLLEKNELSDNEKKQIQRVEHIRMLKRMQSRAFVRSGSWMVDAVEGFKSSFGSFTDRLLGRHVRPVRTRKEDRGRDRDRDQDRNRDSNRGQVTEQLPGAVSDEATSVDAISTAGVKEKETDPTLAGPQRRASRNSQIMQSTGFSAGIGEGGSRTALEDAVLTLADLTKPPSFKSTSMLMRGLSRTSSKRQSFELADYEDVARGVTTIERPWYLREGSLLIFGEKSSLRRVMKKIINSKWWQWFSIGWVGLSTWIVIEMRPTGEPIFSDLAIKILHKLVFGFFMVEMLMKIISNGLIFSPDAIFNDLFNIIDIFLLIVDGLNIAQWSENPRRAVQGLTALRPFRFISRATNLRILFLNLMKTVPAIVALLLFTFSMYVIFGSIGIQLFRGLLYSCNDSNVNDRAYCTGYFYNGADLYSPRVWSNPNFHFDDIGNAFLSLFVCSTFDSWVSYWLYPSMDIVGENQQPQRNNNPAYGLFFVAYCVVGGFYMLRVFIGVFIEEFGKNSGASLLTERQKLWRDMNRIIQKTTPAALPRPPRHFIRKFCFYAIRNRHYQRTMIICCLGYSVFLATNNAKQPAYVSTRRQKAHCALTTYFLLEVLTKFLGDEWRVYKYEYSRHIEAVITLIAVAGLMGVKGTPRGYLGRFGYIIRVFCIIPHVPSAKIIIRTMFICLPIMGDILAILAIFMFGFAGVGYQMFSQVKDGSCIGPSINFRSFVNSFVTVFQVSTLDNWSCIMSDVTVVSPQCTNGSTLLTNDCGYPYGGIIYFVCVVVITSFIFTNLFIAVILDAITFGLVDENSMITPTHLVAFKTLWQQKPFDPEATGYLGMHKLRSFVNALGSPLGRRQNATLEWYMRIEFEVLSFRVPNKGIPFKQLLETLTLYKIGPTGLPLSLRIEREKRIQGIYLHGAATRIEAHVRGFLARRRYSRGGIGGAKPIASEGGGGGDVRTAPMLVEGQE